MSYPTVRSTSTQLLQSSLRVLWQNPKLLSFAFLSFAIGLLFVVLYLGLVVLPPSGQPLFSSGRWAALPEALKAMRGHPASPLRLMLYGNMYVFYVLAMVVTTFLNVAFCHEIIRAMAGEPVSLTGGLRFACGRIRSILAWSLFASVVGLLIRLLAERLGWVGRWVLGLFGVAWSAAAVFVIPIMLQEDNPNPIDLMRKSATTLKKTWGEAVLGFAGIGAAAIVPMLVIAIFPAFLVITVVKPLTPWAIPALIGGQIIVMLGISSVISLANSVYRCALYIYATEGVVPAPYDAGMMDAAWKIKKV